GGRRRAARAHRAAGLLAGRLPGQRVPGAPRPALRGAGGAVGRAHRPRGHAARLRRLPRRHARLPGLLRRRPPHTRGARARDRGGARPPGRPGRQAHLPRLRAQREPGRGRRGERHAARAGGWLRPAATRAVQAAGAPARAADAPPPTTSVALADLDGRTAYRLLTGLVAPRPIAWVSTLSPAGVPNLAPFSFFTLLTGRPPTVMFAAGDRPGGEAKDTLANALATGEFVVNLADRQLAEAVDATSAMVAPDVDEFA